MNPKPEYTFDGKHFDLLWYQWPWAIYKQSGIDHYELMKLRKWQKDYTFKDGHVLKSGNLRYPTTREWGNLGWTFTTLKAAFDKLLKISPNESFSPSPELLSLIQDDSLNNDTKTNNELL